MGEGVGDYLAARLPLQPVVADGRGGRETLFHVTGLEDLAAPVHVVRPYAGVAVRLKLHQHLDVVCGGLVGSPLKPPHPVVRAGEFLDVMAGLVTDDIGLREVTRPP